MADSVVAEGAGVVVLVVEGAVVAEEEMVAVDSTDLVSQVTCSCFLNLDIK